MSSPDSPNNGDDIRTADARVVEVVQQGGRDSTEFRYLHEALREATLGSLLQMGPWLVLREARARGLRIPYPTPASYEEEFPTLCFLAVKTSVEGFMERQVMQGGWSPDGGASLRTFCKTKAIYGFVDQYRRYHREEISSARETVLDPDQHGDDPDRGDGPLVQRVENPEQTVIDRDLIRRALAGKDERLITILDLTAKGLTQKKIADRLGMTPAAVNSLLRRFRNGLA